jgi:hypothetical protein
VCWRAPAGVANVRAAQDAMAAQTLAYAFPFSAFAFPTDLACAVLAAGRASAFFKVRAGQSPQRRASVLTPRQTDLTVRVRARAGADLYKAASAVRVPPPEQLTRFRDLMLGARGVGRGEGAAGKVGVSEATSEVRARSTPGTVLLRRAAERRAAHPARLRARAAAGRGADRRRADHADDDRKVRAFVSCSGSRGADGRDAGCSRRPCTRRS